MPIQKRKMSHRSNIQHSIGNINSHPSEQNSPKINRVLSSEQKRKRNINLVQRFMTKIINQSIKHHNILSNVSSATFLGDKIIRLVSNILKVIRNYNLSSNMISIEKLASEIGQLRRLLRIDRLLLILRDYHGYFDKQKITFGDYYLLFFKALLVFEDMHDLIAFLIQLKIINNNQILPTLRKRVSDIYFFQCLGFAIYHVYELYNAETVQAKKRNIKTIIKYILDSLSSYNDYSRRKFTLSPKITCIIGIVSSLLNLYLVWK